MATQQPQSTISYNTELFLKEQLEIWHHQHIIQSYMYIKHIGEDGDKNHIHLRIELNKRLDVMNLTDKLKQPDLHHPEKPPLGVRPWRSSKEEDWILYAVHDPDYMKIKYPNDTKEKLPYKWQDIKASDGFDVETAYLRARQSLEHCSASLLNRLGTGESPVSMVMSGENPMLVRNMMQLLNGFDYTEKCKELEKEKGQCQIAESKLWMQIEENSKLKQTIADQNKRIEELEKALKEFREFGVIPEIK